MNAETLKRDLDSHYRREGVDGGYSVNDQAVRVIFSHGYGTGEGADGFGHGANMRVRSYGDNGITVPENRETIRIDGVDWSVLSAGKSADGLEWIIQAEKVE